VEQTKEKIEPDNTAVRTALWRALHVIADAKPHIVEDEIGLKLIAPPAGWQERPDMKFTRRLRASIVARARFVEDLVIDERKKGIDQYAILGAGLDSFAERRTETASKLQIYEIDHQDTLAWKKQRLTELGFGIPANLHFVPVDFESSSWWHELLKAGFDSGKPAVVASTGLTIYLNKSTILSTLKRIALLPTGSKLAMTFYLPMDLLDEEDRPLMEMSTKGAREAGTPFVSFFSPEEILDFAHGAGFKEAKTISTKDMEQLYFRYRTDNLLPSSGEVFLVGTT
jgi:methyltransferase (TIGR00027 family)